MPSIRDEFSKVVGVRIPENGYRKYVKELSRTGAFAGLQHENAIIILLEAVDELQRQLVALTPKDASPLPPQVVKDLQEHYAHAPETLHAAVTCPTCGKEFKSSLGLMGHSVTHKPKDERSILPTQTKPEAKEPVQSK